MPVRSNIQGFAPLAAPQARALVLGSYPSPKSFETGFYYGHPQNRFWKLLAALSGRRIPTGNDEKRALIIACGLALWDVLESCTITGASDASITNPQPNDIASFTKAHGISAVFCNGATAHRLYTRHCEKLTDIAAIRLPSTSPANAAFSLQRLQKAWQPLVPYITATEGSIGSLVDL